MIKTLLTPTFIFCVILSCVSAQDNIYTEHNQEGPSVISYLEAGVFKDVPSTGVFPLTSLEIVGIVLIIFIAGLANAGGVGGGPLLSSILMMFFSYNPTTSNQVVYTLVFAGSLGNYFNVVGRKNPQTKKPMIDYDLALLCMPPMVFGTNIGIMFERMAAPLVIIIGIIIVTTYSTIQVFRNAIKLYKEESKRLRAVKPESAKDDVTDPLLQKEDTTVEIRVAAQEQEEDGNSPRLSPEESTKAKKFIKAESKLFPKTKYAIMLFLLSVVMVTAVFRGTDEFKSFINLPYCGGGYWGLFAGGQIIVALIFIMNIKILKNKIKTRKAYAETLPKSEFELNNSNMVELTIVALIAGFLAGLLGIGGGMIMKPTLLGIGVASQTVAATSGFFVLQTSFISLFQSLLFQDIPLTDQAFFFAISLFGSFGVSYALNWIIKKKNRPSIILFTLFAVLVVSIVATPIFEVWINLSNFDQLIHFNSFC